MTSRNTPQTVFHTAAGGGLGGQARANMVVGHLIHLQNHSKGKLGVISGIMENKMETTI